MLNFTKGKWLVHEEYPYGIPIYPKQYYIYLDNGKPEDYFIVCANKADARLIAAAPDMYEALKECYDFIEDIICHDCEYCSRSLDADGLRIALDDLFAGIDGKEVSA